MVLVEHHLDMVLQLCDQVTVMAAGTVLCCGTPGEIRDRPEVLDAYIGKHAEYAKTDPPSGPAEEAAQQAVD